MPGRTTRSSLLVLALALGAQLPCSAKAELTLAYEAPATCPSATRTHARMSTLMGDALVDSVSAHVSLAIEEVDGGYRAHVSASAGPPREIGALDCAQLVDAALVVAAVALDPLAFAAHQVPADDSVARVPAAPPPPVATYSPPAEPQVTTPTTTHVHRLFTGASAIGDVGSLPGAALGLALFGGANLGRTRSSLGLQGFLPRSASHAGRTLGEMGLYTADIQVCLELGRDAWRAGPCFAFEAGLATGRGLDVDQGAYRVAKWGALRGGLVLRGTRGRLTPALAVEALCPWWRPSFDVEGIGQVFRARPVALRAALSWSLNLF